MLPLLRRYFLGLFFVPDKTAEANPAQFGLDFDHVTFKSFDGRLLSGYFLKAKKAGRGHANGTIVHCHGNTGNITTHFSLMTFLVEANYNVFTFDYGGYGESEGRPTPKGIIGDTRAALAYVRSRSDVDKSRMVLFGQSLGGAAAAGAMTHERDIVGLILEGTFTTYREMAFVTLIGRILFFLTPFLIPREGPLLDLPHIQSRPVLIVHGDHDDTIPVRFGQKLYDAASGDKSLAVLKSFGHLDGAETGSSYRDIILRFLNRILLTPQPN